MGAQERKDKAEQRIIKAKKKQNLEFIFIVIIALINSLLIILKLRLLY